MNEDFSKLIDATALEQTKQISPYVGKNTNMSTTLSQQKDFDPTNTTIFDVSEIFQNIASFQNTSKITNTFENTLSKQVAPNVGNTILSNIDSKYAYLKALVPEDVSLEGTVDSPVQSTDPNNPNNPTGTYSGGSASQGESPLTPEQKTLANAVVNHPMLGGIGSDNKDDILTGKISPYIMSALKLLMDSNIKIWITATRSDHKTKTASGSISLHSAGKAVDIRPNGSSGSIASQTTWIDSVYRTMDSLMAPQRPVEVGGPYVYKNSGHLGASGIYTLRQDDHGTRWFTAQDHQNHIHIGITAWGPA